MIIGILSLVAWIIALSMILALFAHSIIKLDESITSLIRSRKDNK